MEKNYKLTIAYDGTRFFGWERQPGRDTIQGKLETALSRILGEPIEISGSGRTDAGVHAKGQVASFHCESPMPPAEILANLRRYLPEDIGIYSCREVSPRFHARLNAREKTYVYRIWNSEAPCVFERRFVTVMPEPLDVEAMNRAGALLVGRHDFSAFCGNPKMKKSTVRELYALTVTRQGEEIVLRFTGNGFLYNMVRILTGTLVEVGRQQRSPESVTELFGAKRAQAGFLAPAQGLCLEEVVY